MKKILSVLLIIALLCSLLSGCNTKPKVEKFTDYSFLYFDTVTTIIAYEESQKVFKENCNQIKLWLAEYHKLYDIYTTYDNITNLCILNRTQGEPQKVDKKIIDLLEFAKTLYKKNPKLNVAMGSVLSVWHDYREFALNNPDKASLPAEFALKETSKHTNFDDVYIDSEKSTVLIKDEGLSLDVGAIGKGFAAQEVAKKMKEKGMEGYLLNLGGNVKIVGERKDGNNWTVGIESPEKESEDDFIAELSLTGDMSLVTSGSYQRFFTVKGKDYHHIIDSDTLYPAKYFKSVSILCEDSGLADGLSTLLFCLPQKDGKKLIESMENVHAMWVTTDGELLYSKDFKNFLIKK
jgi:thiamine biosynthesis lipoprotein